MRRAIHILVSLNLVVYALAGVGPARAEDVSWKAAVNGNWNDASKWDKNRVPGPDDRAIIAIQGTADYTVTLNTSATVGGLTLGATTAGALEILTVSSSLYTLTLNGPSVVEAQGRLNLLGGTIAGPGDLTVNGQLSWTSGSMSGTGQTVIAAPTGVMTLNPGSSTTLARVLKNESTVNWVGGTLKLNGGTLINGDEVNPAVVNLPSSGSFSTSGGDNIFTNGELGTVSKTTGTYGTVMIGVPFDNAGTVTIADNAGTLEIGAGGDSSGQFTIGANGTLKFSGAAGYAGNSNSEATGSGTLSFTGPGTCTWDGVVDLTGTGACAGGNTVFNGPFMATTLNCTGGAASFNGQLAATTVSWSGGTASFNGPSTIGTCTVNYGNGSADFNGPASIGTCNVSGSSATINFNGTGSAGATVGGGTLSYGTWGGSGEVAITGTVIWSGGTMGGTGRTIVATGGLLEIKSGSTSLSRVLDNAGTVNLQTTCTVTNATIYNRAGAVVNCGSLGDVWGDGIFIQNQADAVFNWGDGWFLAKHTIIENQAGAVFNAAPSSSMPLLLSSNGGRFDNAGTFEKTGAYWVEVYVPFNNANIVSIAQGGLDLGGGGTHTGDFTLFDGAELDLGGAAGHTFAPGADISGVGDIWFYDGNNVLDAQLVLTGTAWFTGGATALNALCAVGTLDSWDSGFVNFNGTTTATTLSLSGGTVNFNNPDPNAAVIGAGTFSGGALGGSGLVRFTGTLVWTGGTMAGLGRTLIDPLGALTISGGADKELGRFVDNSGTASLTAATLTFDNGVFNNLDGATFVSVGNSSLAGGGAPDAVNIFSNAPGATFLKGSELPTAIGVRFDNSGWVDVEQGTMHLLGNDQNHAFTNSGDVNIEPGATLSAIGVYTQAAGTTTLDDSTLIAAGGVSLGAGTLTGNGTVQATVTNTGVVAPGLSGGLIHIAGDYHQNASGRLDIELGGTTPGEGFDRVTVDGDASLSGTLYVLLTNGFVPHVDDTFTILTCAARSGEFSNIATYPPTLGVAATYNADSVVIRITHVPGIVGDLNCDGAVNAFDIDPFVLALTDSSGYAAAYPNCNILNADTNCDGAVNAFDIDPFVQCLTVGCPPCP